MMNTCKLCNRNKELKKSHIIPEFMYSSIYDDDHKFYVLSTSPNNKTYKKQTGEWERLLCNDCEVKLSRYERYVSLVMNGGIELELQQGKKLLKIGRLDYPQFKLFQLSVLWRASISKRLLFSNVKLVVHEEKIRQMLLSETPSKENEYGCITKIVYHNKKPVSSFITMPEKIRIQGEMLYQFAFGGFWWYFHVASHMPNIVMRELFLKESGTLIMLKGEFEDSRYIQDLAKQMYGKI